MKVLITGASGFVGGAVMRHARARGWEVYGLGRRALAVPGYVSVDLTRPFELDFRPDVVIHAAARSSPWGRRRDFESQNVKATRHVLDFCARQGQPHLIYISTAAVLYRNEHQLNLREDAPIPAAPINEYARSKQAAERLVQAYPGDWCILRPRAVFGPGDTVVFPRLLRAMSRGRLPVIPSKPPVMADLIYIDVLAEYILRAADHRATGVYHLTNGQPVEIYPFLNRLAAELRLPAATRVVNAKTALRMAHAIEVIYRLLPFLGEPPVTAFGVSVLAYSKTFDVTRARRDLGPPAMSLEAGVSKFIAWQRTQPSA